MNKKWMQYSIMILAIVILGVTITVLKDIWKSTNAFEVDRSVEHEYFATNISDTLNVYISTQNPELIGETIKKLTEISFLQYISYNLPGREPIENGDVNGIDRNWIKKNNENEEMSYSDKTSDLLYINRPVIINKSKKAVLTTVFSLEELKNNQGQIKKAIFIIVSLLALLALLIWLVIRLYNQLELAEQKRKDMIYALTHDAKQDLTVIQGKSESLMRKLNKGSSMENADRQLKSVQESSDAIDRFLTNLRDQEKLGRGEVEEFPEDVDLQKLVQTIVNGFDERFMQRGLDVTCQCKGDYFNVFADQEILKRVVRNLVHNAMKYSFDNKPIVINVEQRNAIVSVDIINYGPLISDDNRERIFKPFVQLDTKKEGMGLGLATARELIEKKVKGTLELIESSATAGNIFRITLPLHDQVAGV